MFLGASIYSLLAHSSALQGLEQQNKKSLTIAVYS